MTQTYDNPVEVVPVVPDTPQELAAPPRLVSQVTRMLQSGLASFVQIKDEDRTPFENMVGRCFTFLASFRSANGIAKFLEAEGIKGDRSILNSCPISNYVAAHSEGTVVTTDAAVISVKNGDNYYYVHKCTPEMLEFITKFDQGYYPQLVR